MNDQYNNKTTKPLSPKAIVIIVLVIVLAVIEVIALGVFVFMSDSNPESIKEETKIVYVQQENEEKPESSQKPMQQPTAGTQTEVTPANNSSNNTATSKPTSQFTEDDVKAVITAAVHGYVNGMNTNNHDYIYGLFYGNALTKEYEEFMDNYSEDVHLSLKPGCLQIHDIKKISDTEFTAMRTSIIINTSGEEVPECCSYVLEDINGELLITYSKMMNI